MSEETLFQDLMKEADATMRLLTEKWGQDIETPFGSVGTGCQKAWYIGPRGGDIAISNYDGGYWAKRAHGIYGANVNDVMNLSEKLAAMVQYLASEDFQNKVKGSIRQLKRVNLALRG